MTKKNEKKEAVKAAANAGSTAILKPDVKTEAPKPDEIKRIDVQEFREFGYLQEVNRQFLHPLGLALEVVLDDPKKEMSKQKVLKIGGVWDYRDDPDGMAFSDLSDEDSKGKFDRVEAERVRMSKSREERLGFTIQPIGHKFTD